MADPVVAPTTPPPDTVVAPIAPVEPVAPTVPPVEPVAPAVPPVEPVAPVVPPATPAEPVAQAVAPVAPEADPVAVAPVVPAANEYKLPEGVDASIGVFANANGYTQEQLDNTLTHFGSIMHSQKVAEQTTLTQLGEQQIKDWGDKADYNINLAKRALKQNDPEGSLLEVLNSTGYGNHPAVLTFMHRLGVSMQEGGFLKAPSRGDGKKSVAQTMYPNHPSKE